MKIEKLKQGQAVFVKGIITDIEKDEILDLEIHTSENNFYVNSSDVYVSIDQPKPVVPQFVADWYENNKDRLEEAICSLVWLIGRIGSVTDIECWFTKTENSIQTLINMHQFGYTFEKEKLYTVEIPNPNWGGDSVTILSKNSKNRIVITRCVEDNWKNIDFVQLTEEEIRNDFDWAWQFAKEVTE